MSKKWVQTNNTPVYKRWKLHLESEPVAILYFEKFKSGKELFSFTVFLEGASYSHIPCESFDETGSKKEVEDWLVKAYGNKIDMHKEYIVKYEKLRTELLKDEVFKCLSRRVP